MQMNSAIVCSMGGILVKEMLAKALSDSAPDHHRQLAAATSGLVFYACPHLGTNLANIGWNLRYVGASPAASVVHLKPGKHLEVTALSRLLSDIPSKHAGPRNTMYKVHSPLATVHCC